MYINIAKSIKRYGYSNMTMLQHIVHMHCNLHVPVIHRVCLSFNFALAGIKVRLLLA